jgi:hypothetical protein
MIKAAANMGILCKAGRTEAVFQLPFQAVPRPACLIGENTPKQDYSLLISLKPFVGPAFAGRQARRATE